MSTMIDIDSLKALQAIQQYGGVTRAAHYLGLSQSAVSHKIKRLETRLDCVLLNRQAGRPLLTESGQRLMDYGRRILALHDEAVYSLSQRTLHGQIRVGITEDVTGSTLATVLARFKQLYPNVAVRVHVDQSLRLGQAAADGKLDLAVMQVFASEITADDTVLATEKLHWVKAHHLSVPGERPIPFLAFDDDCFYKNWVFETQQQEQQFEVVMMCPSNRGICAAVEAGLGVALLNERYISKQMVVVDDLFFEPPNIVYVVRMPNSLQAPVLRALTAEIVQAF